MDRNKFLEVEMTKWLCQYHMPMSIKGRAQMITSFEMVNWDVRRLWVIAIESWVTIPTIVKKGPGHRSGHGSLF